MCMRVTVALVMAVGMLSSCISAGEGPGTAEPSPSAATRPYVRGCDNTVSGRLERGYRAESTNIGPLTFVRLPRLAANREEIRGGSKVFPTKVLVTVVEGHRAAVEVPGEAADRLRLFYDPAQWDQRGRIQVTTGQRAVEFMACPKGRGPPRSHSVQRRFPHRRGGLLSARRIDRHRAGPADHGVVRREQLSEGVAGGTKGTRTGAATESFA
jgi:hypothetical protein